MVKLAAVVLFGVPLMTPVVGLSVAQAGKAPALTAKVMAPLPPVALIGLRVRLCRRCHWP
jgi:hypothetical protein